MEKNLSSLQNNETPDFSEKAPSKPRKTTKINAFLRQIYNIVQVN